MYGRDCHWVRGTDVDRRDRCFTTPATRAVTGSTKFDSKFVFCVFTLLTLLAALVFFALPITALGGVGVRDKRVVVRALELRAVLLGCGEMEGGEGGV